MPENKDKGPINKVLETAGSALIYTTAGIAMRFNERFRTHWLAQMALYSNIDGSVTNWDKWSLRFLPSNQQDEAYIQISELVRERDYWRGALSEMRKGKLENYE